MTIIRTIVCFHITRGGRFFNGGHLEYRAYVSPSDVLKYNDTNLFDGENDEGELCYFDSSGHELCPFDDVASGEFRMEFDGHYNTWYCTDLEKCDESELKAIIEANADNVERAKELMVENGYVPEGWYEQQEEEEAEL